ncbi:MBL fold metallo-hydrolase [Cognaticolwellia mytili]|uniref:MBL fold metallo-hydrolase n=1 Tax=Cognaticolwellia mytili TaxID=1888913 RepID=UPI001F233F64|nr:MBL fold metallo-hydrolase [Cognaticolwellia mytili]
MLKNIIKGLALSLVFSPFVMANSVCNQDRVTLQVLGSGGPELDDGRASSSYLIWLDGKARALVDLGSGANVNFGQANARLEDISAIMLTHLHVDHSADLPAFVKGAFFSDREDDLTILGPEGNALMPSTTQFVSRLFGNKGAYAYLSNYLEPEQRSAFKLKTKDIALGLKAVSHFPVGKDLILSTIPVHHGPIAAVAWRVDIAGCAITFSGDMNNQYQTLETLALNSDILVMHNAVPETASGVATHLHMTPSQIGRIAQKAKVKKLVISHRMNRTLGKEKVTTQQTEQSYKGPIFFANDLDKFRP